VHLYHENLLQEIIKHIPVSPQKTHKLNVILLRTPTSFRSPSRCQTHRALCY